QGCDRRYGEVDAARDDHDRLTNGENGHEGRLPGHREEIGERQEVRGGEREDQHEQEKRYERTASEKEDAEPRATTPGGREALSPSLCVDRPCSLTRHACPPPGGAA